MKNKELVRHLTALDPEADVELNVDLAHPGCKESQGARSDRRILEVRHKRNHNVIEIIGTGEFRPAEETKLDAGLYNREYASYMAWWDNLSKSQRREALQRAQIKKWWVFDEDRWDELDLLQQQMIMVRVERTITLEGALV